MYIFQKQADLIHWRKHLEINSAVGFIPTMGALHKGHLSLIQSAHQQCDWIVASIFVNPTQFNNPEDLEKYPRQPEKDIEMLEKSGCHAVYLPDVSDIYDSDTNYDFDLGTTGNVFEGPLRPGHFNGVVNVCKRLFEIISPTDVYFGQKDFQQCAVINKMISHYKMEIRFHRCEIIRESDGLAMSSRNVRLNPSERILAPKLYELMSGLVKNAYQSSPEELCEKLQLQISEIPAFSIEYIAVVDSVDLKPAVNWNWETVLLVACKFGPIRLLDNIIIPAK